MEEGKLKTASEEELRSYIVSALFTCAPVDRALVTHKTEHLFLQWRSQNYWSYVLSIHGVTLAQLVKASVGQAQVQKFEPHLWYNWLSYGVFPVKSRHFGLPLAQTISPNWQYF